MATIDNTPVIAIVGPTASGKTGLALQLAQRFGCEIIAADSRTIYRGLDIGTAKPTDEERGIARHWGLDLVKPNERFSAKEFQDYANQVCANIAQRGKVPLIVGGTGLYIDAYMYDFAFPETDQDLRKKLEQLSIEDIIQYCNKNNITLPGDPKNRRRVIHVACRNGQPTSRQMVLSKHKHIVAIATDSRILRERITGRAHIIFSSGVVEEAIKVADEYGWSAPGLSGNIYRIIHAMERGELTRQEAIDRFVTLDWQLAKRQMTWFRRDPNILWVQLDEAEEKISRLLKAN